MELTTIVSHDGKIMQHGIITQWTSHDEFVFVPQGQKASQAFWCKLDYWRIIYGVRINILNVK